LLEISKTAPWEGNTPVELNPFKTLEGGISPKLTAIEMAALGRYMPFLLYDLVDINYNR
jgi:hypothetical protein